MITGAFPFYSTRRNIKGVCGMAKPSLAPFIWETHGVHAGTNADHVKHGVDSLDAVALEAIARGYPSVSFIIHTPRLTGVRYQSERNTDIKFIRGDRAYTEYPELMRSLRARYAGRLDIRYGIELEWQGSGLGLQWNNSKVFQCRDADFIVGSVHFSREGLPYDGSREEADRLLALRGGPEGYWLGYLDEMIEMVDQYRDLIHVVGHLDLPKLHVPLPEGLTELDKSSSIVARKMTMLLELIGDTNLALDLNLAGLRKGCGAYPHPAILQRARSLGISLAIGSDAHAPDELGSAYGEGIRLAREAGYSYYLSFSKGIAEKRPLDADAGLDAAFRLLNMGTLMLGQRFAMRGRGGASRFSFGGRYRALQSTFKDAVSLGAFDAIRVRRAGKSITLGDEAPPPGAGPKRYLYSRHKDIPGTLAILLNTMASELINVDTAYLEALHDGTASAYLTVSAESEALASAIDFVRGTAGDRFLELCLLEDEAIPAFRGRGPYLLELDGVDLTMPLSPQMLLTVHDNKPGTLLVLLSALASINVNVLDLQLGERGSKGFAALGVEGDAEGMRELVGRLGDGFMEASFVALSLPRRGK